MSDLAWGWLLFTPFILVLGVGAFFDKAKQDYGPSLFVSLITVVPLWWLIYLIAKHVFGYSGCA